MAENRLHAYKNKGLDEGETRNRRREKGIELRKNKRVDQQAKRRNYVEEDEPESAPLANVDTNTSTPSKSSVGVAQLPAIINDVKSQDPEVVTQGTQRCRQLLSKERNPPIQEVIDAGLVPYFVQFLGAQGHEKLQFEAAWTLTNIASGASHQTRAVVEAGAVPYFIQLLGSTNDEIVDQSIWALGNIAGDSPSFRDGVLASGILPPLSSLLQRNDIKLGMRRNATWTMSNLCRGKDPQPQLETVRGCIPIVAQQAHHHDEEVMTDAAWALSYLTDGENERIQEVVNSGVVPRLVELLQHTKTSVQIPALRAVGNIVTGSDFQTQTVIDNGALPAFRQLINSHKENIRKETCWTISNITAGNKAQIQSVIEAGLIPALISATQRGDFRTRKEAAWAISNLTIGGSTEQLQFIVNQGVIKPLTDLLTAQDTKLVRVVLDASANLLKIGDQADGSNVVADYFEECGAMDKIESLQEHENTGVYEKAFSIIEQYFSEEGDEELDMGPTVEQTNTFSFAPAPAIAAGGFAF
eukprot:m.337620 g.337620  ORF g.337620 m.337620 type:complete len:527 (-) comp18185_c0_seq1:183-1763(-)